MLENHPNQSFESGMADEYFTKLIEEIRIFSKQIWTAISRFRTETGAQENAIQNMLIASMVISVFAIKEMITRKSPTTLGHKLRKDTNNTLDCT
jgi:hypothetical protein